MNFENRVQSSFVVLMLTGGFSPCLPTWPIVELKLQGKYQEFETDDLIVFAQQPGEKRTAKLLGQIKHSIKITKKDKIFGEVIQAAWKDFKNPKVFNEKTDAIALITGPLSALDTDHVRALLRQAQNSKNEEDFFQRIELANFTNENQRTKLEIFKVHLKRANNNVEITKDELWRFLKSFHLLLYDLDIKGVTLSLLHSLIGQYSYNRSEELLALIEKHLTYVSENAGHVNLDSLPENIYLEFIEPVKRNMPKKFEKISLGVNEIESSTYEFESQLAIANLFGSWDENNENDIEFISNLIHEDFSLWMSRIRKVLYHQDSLLKLNNGIWNIEQREEMWKILGSHIFDEDLEKYAELAVSVLSELDPRFSLPSEKRFAASIYGKKYKYSLSLRKGIAASLVLLSISNDFFVNCSFDKPNKIVKSIIYKLLDKAEWQLWGSLNQVLPLLAEAAPLQFLAAVEKALLEKSSPFDNLFLEEGDVIGGENYLTGLLWALELLAWNEEYLVRVTVILGELALCDPGGRWSNRPGNSLITIFLPWLPQTNASVEKRRVAIQTLVNEVETIGWNLLINLLPNQTKISSESYKPRWRKVVTEKKEEVTQDEYFIQVQNYSELMLDIANDDIEKISEIVKYLGNLPPKTYEGVLKKLSTSDIMKKPEQERYIVWEELIKLVKTHRRFSDSEWSMEASQVKRIEKIAQDLAPKDPKIFYNLLFSSRDFEFYEENGNWKDQRKDLERRRKSAVEEILSQGGLNSLIEFVRQVEAPHFVGNALAYIESVDIESNILPQMLNKDDNKTSSFVRAFVNSKYNLHGDVWIDSLSINKWHKSNVIKFLTLLPFTEKVWNLVHEVLNENEKEYWNIVEVQPYLPEKELNIVIEKLIKYKRMKAALECLYSIYRETNQIDTRRVVQALLYIIENGEPINSNDSFHYIELIRGLQNDSNTNSDDLFKIEWFFLPLLEKRDDIFPKTLEQKMAIDSSFFVEVIRYAYRSKKEEKLDVELSDNNQAIALNAYRLLNEWKTPPGINEEKLFFPEQFKEWILSAKEKCERSGHFDVALSHIGKVLFYSPPDTNGLWINRVIAKALNSKDAEKMREGYRIEVFNSRGAFFIDPSGKPEKKLSENFRRKAEEVENAGFYRFAATLKNIADYYEHDAEMIRARNPLND